MSNARDKFLDSAKGKKIIMFGATTSARDMLETVFSETGITADYICDFNKDKQCDSFENQYQNISVKAVTELEKENPDKIFVLITTLFEAEAEGFLQKNKIHSFMSARDILNEIINVEEYWNDRYKKGYDTGVQTTGFLLEKQADFVNEVIEKYSVKTVFELGCGDGKILPYLKLESYTGVDISTEAIRICREKFKPDSGKSFFVAKEYVKKQDFDLSLSLGNVIPSLPNDDEYQKYMDSLFGASRHLVCIFSSDFESAQYGHIRARNFSKYVEENLSDWRLAEIKETGFEYKKGDPTEAKFYIYIKAVS